MNYQQIDNPTTQTLSTVRVVVDAELIEFIESLNPVGTDKWAEAEWDGAKLRVYGPNDLAEGEQRIIKTQLHAFMGKNRKRVLICALMNPNEEIPLVSADTRMKEIAKWIEGRGSLADLDNESVV